MMTPERNRARIAHSEAIAASLIARIDTVLELHVKIKRAKAKAKAAAKAGDTAAALSARRAVTKLTSLQKAA